MLKVSFSTQAEAFFLKIPKKHARQITERIEKIANNPSDVPSKQLEGYPALRRAKSGEYRIIYRIDEGVLNLLVLRVGKRNDGEVYRGLETLLSGVNFSNLPDETDISWGKAQGSEEI